MQRSGLRNVFALLCITEGATLAAICRDQGADRMATRRVILARAGGLFAAATLAPLRALAQQFPARPVRIIVPFPPGGPADTAVRVPQGLMEKMLGQSIIIENVPGAAGGIGAVRVKQSEPDGYTLLQAASPHTTNAAIKPDGNVDLLRDFLPVGLTGVSVYTLCASKALAAATLSEAISRAKAKPGELKIGSVGVGSTHHLIAEMLKSSAGIELTHVPYRGEAPAILDLIAGRIDLMFLTSAKPHIDGGQVVGLGVTSDEPWFNLPGLKPLNELGLRDMVISGWNGLMMPKGTPPAAVAKLSEALSAGLRSDAAVSAFNAMGFKPGTGTPGPMAAQITRDMELFTRVIRERNLKFDT
jgi:tripartite-type tricarboxylate transporter receptor subunit TctC